MEEGWMLVEEGLFHPEEPSFPLWNAMMLTKDASFVLGIGLFLPEEGVPLPFTGEFLFGESRIVLREASFSCGQPFRLEYFA